MLRNTIFVYLVGATVHQMEVSRNQVERFTAGLKYPLLGTVLLEAQ